MSSELVAAVQVFLEFVAEQGIFVAEQGCWPHVRELSQLVAALQVFLVSGNAAGKAACFTCFTSTKVQTLTRLRRPLTTSGWLASSRLLYLIY